MNITIIGAGYVGLVSGVCLASKGHDVTCIDLRNDVVNKLNNAVPPIYESGLEDLLAEVIQKKSFRASTDLNSALHNCPLIILAVGTPSENGEIDLSQITAASQMIGEYIKRSDKYISVIVKSTVIPGTTDTYIREIIETISGKTLGEFGLGMNPEFLREGNAIEDFLYPDRIVFGFEDSITKERLEEVYAAWSCDKIYVNTRTAEMIKYANNTVLASLISLNNELANLAGLIGNIDYDDIVTGISKDKRWSPILSTGQRIYPQILSYLSPGAGFGGSCFPKDVQAIRTQGLKYGLKMQMTNSILDVNDTQATNSINILKDYTGKLDGKKVLLLGLTFKPNTDDIRESSAIKIMNGLIKEGCIITAHDPIAIDKIRFIHNEIQYTENWRLALEENNYDIIVIGTNWDEYLHLKTIDSATNLLSGKVLFDTKRLFKRTEIQSAVYITIGYNPKMHPQKK